MPFTESASVFINPNTPGYVLAKINGLDIPALVDYQDEAFDFVKGTKTSILISQDDANNTQCGDSVLVNNVNYVIREISNDGHGIPKLFLEAA